MQNLIKIVIFCFIIFFWTMSIIANAQNNNSEVLYLDSDTSLVLPYFDTSSIVDSNIDAITLSLYVLGKTPDELNQLQITINPIDLNSNVVGDGISSFINASKGNYIDFRLPKELFEQSIQTPKRFLVYLATKGQKIVLKGTDSVGTVQDPKLIVEHSKLSENESPDQPEIVEYNYYNIKNTQLHFGEGDNVWNNKVEAKKISMDDIPLWLKWLVALGTIFGLMWGVYVYFHPSSNVQQIHLGKGDNVAGDKIINNNLDIPKPEVSTKQILTNNPVEGGYQSEFLLSINAVVPIKNLYVRANASDIIRMDVTPQRTGVAMFGPSGKRNNFAFTNIVDAYGDYKIRILTEASQGITFEFFDE